MYDLDFNLSTLQIITHPQYQSYIPRITEGLKKYHLVNHFVILSSGTTGGDLKGYALSKEALFANARATNEHFNLTENDVWGLSLPIYHVGGLSVLARAHLLKNKVIDARKWDPVNWGQNLQNSTVSTIVPTQLYDLVKLNVSPPKSLRYLIVGGDLLSSSLEEEALKIGWPVVRTFGMTEVSSQLASASFPGSKVLKVLPIHEVKSDQDNRLLVKSSSLFTLQFTLSQKIEVWTASALCDQDGFYKTNDKGAIVENSLTHQGRFGDEVKISGHLINLNQLKNKLSDFLFKKKFFNKMEFILEKDDRKGHKLILLSLPEAEFLSQEISDIIHPIKIDGTKVVNEFERTSLGKLKKN